MKISRNVVVVAIVLCVLMTFGSLAWSAEKVPTKQIQIPQVKMPDLIIESITGPSGATVGGAVQNIKVRVKNIGTAVAAGGFRIDVVLSTDTAAPVSPGTVSPTFVEDTLLGGGGSVMTITGDLAPGAWRETILSLNQGAIPQGIKQGIYYLCATADVNKTISESNEKNNTTCYRIYIK